MAGVKRPEDFSGVLRVAEARFKDRIARGWRGDHGEYARSSDFREMVVRNRELALPFDAAEFLNLEDICPARPDGVSDAEPGKKPSPR